METTMTMMKYRDVNHLPVVSTTCTEIVSTMGLQKESSFFFYNNDEVTLVLYLGFKTTSSKEIVIDSLVPEQ